MKICKPYKDCSPTLISQRFGNPQPFGGTHTGVDFVPLKPLQNTVLVAPCRVQIVNIVDNFDLDENSDEEIRRGYGILMKPLEGDWEPNTYFIYWHCAGIFPVKINDVVEQGLPVANMSNSGMVYVGGNYVPIANRNAPPYYGKHLHFEAFVSTNGVREYFDIVPYINWIIEVKDTGVLDSIKVILDKIASLLK